MSEKELLDKARKIVNIEMISPGKFQREIGCSYVTAEHLRDTVVDELQEEAIILRRFQDWRRGYDVRNMFDAGIDSKELGIAIDKILAFFGYAKPLTDCGNCKHNIDAHCDSAVCCREVKEVKGIKEDKER